MELTGWVVYLLSFVAFFLLGFYLISAFLFQDYEIKNRFPLLVFSGFFSFSMLLLEMVFFEIFDLGTSDTRYLKWIVTLSALTYSAIFFLPTFLMVKFLKKLKFNRPVKIILSIGCGFIYWWLVIRELVKNSSYETENARFWDFLNVFEIFMPITQVKFLASIGMVILAILSGFGAVNTPFNFFNVYNEKMLLLNQSAFDQKMIEVLENISQKKIKNLQLKARVQERNPQKQENEGFLRKLFRRQNTLTELERQIEENELEIKMLKKSHNELFVDYCEFVREMEVYKVSKTLKGKFRTILAKFLSFYCIYRLITSLINSWRGREEGIDPINRSLMIGFKLLDIEVDKELYRMISSIVSFIFLGILIVMNVRSFVKNILQIVRMIMRRLLSEMFFSEIVVYVLGEILAIYFVSTFILMYNNFPVYSREKMREIFGTLDFRSLYKVFDKIFIISALSSLAIIWLNNKIKKMKYNRYLEDQEFETYKTK